MANPEDLALLQQRVAAWNEWRKNDQALGEDLSGAAKAQTREKLGKNHRHDCYTEERNTDDPRYEKAVTRKFFGKNDNG
jgi:hypothetical protein